MSGIEDIKADGKDTVIFTLKSGNSDFPFLMADWCGLRLCGEFVEPRAVNHNALFPKQTMAAKR